MHKDGIQMFKR